MKLVLFLFSLFASATESEPERLRRHASQQEKGGLFHRRPADPEGNEITNTGGPPGRPPRPRSDGCPPSPIGMGEMLPEELRFNKVSFADEVDSTKYEHLFPLQNDSYPISGNVSDALKASRCHSVVTSDDYEVKFDVGELIATVGGEPDHPSSSFLAPYWDKLREVMKVQEKRLKGGLARDVMPVPDAWMNKTMDEAAECVHDEYPGLHQSLLVDSFLRGKYGDVVVDDAIIPRRCYGRFLSQHVMLADMNTWAVGLVGPHNFGAKYYAGRARPEEVVWAIKNNTITEGVPDRIRCDAKNLRISKAEEFTAYEEGSPPHPSWPAMHSAASCASFWLSVVLNITDQQFCEAKKTDFAVAYARTVAGVHFADDNIAGLSMGQEIVARSIAKHIAEKYGGNETAVWEKVKRTRFSWADFNASDPCPELSR